MTFTSKIFLIGLFPFFVIIYNWLKDKNITIRRMLFLLANSIFLVWGGAGAFILLCIYATMVYIFADFVYKSRSRGLLIISLIFSVAPLVVIKYTTFIINSINSITGLNTVAPAIVIPIGISFITFEAESLLVDIHKAKTDKKPSLLDTYLYLTFFPTVTSGPILRYNEFSEGLHNKAGSCNYVVAIERIARGLCKKILIADKIAILADYYFDGVSLGNNYSCLGLWIGSIAYTLQLYFDFSGYSDMAIGIGELLGFRIKENFNKPYQAHSISDFWKRWHISLTRWFRDYIYIPLGGNRCSYQRHILNMLVVWLLTGIWHGADWTFVIWGISYFILIAVEKYFPNKILHSSNVISHLYTLFFVNLLWIPFRADSLLTSAKYILGMFGGGKSGLEERAMHFIPLIIFAIALCLPWEIATQKVRTEKWFVFLKDTALIIIVCLAICGLVNSSYAPYIYGNF